MEIPGIRLQKALAQAGLGSRRACDALVSDGHVTVNGVRVEAGTRIDPASDEVRVRGERVEFGVRTVVLALNKPRGVVTTMADDQGRPCVGDFVSGMSERLFHVGRLDEDTSGLLLLTNDGDLSNRLMHPSHGVQKTYVAKVRGRITPSVTDALLSGVTLEDGLARADSVQVRSASEHNSIVEIVLHEGRKRIVRRMCKAVGHPVLELTRTRIGSLRLGNLPVGEMRELTSSEIAQLESEIS